MLHKILAFLGLARGAPIATPASSRKNHVSGQVVPGAHLRAHEPHAQTAAHIASMSVALPPDRSSPGTLLALSADGTLLSGPWPAIGRANAQFATSRGNPSRSRTLPFGDVPTGTYELSGKSSTPAGSEAAFGRFGALSFSPLDGEAAAAEAVGRTGLLLHGGKDWRASTDGSLRVPDFAIEEILSMLPADPAAMRPRVPLNVNDAENCDGWRIDPSEGSGMRRMWARQFLSDRSKSSDNASSNSGVTDDDPVEDTFPSMFQLLYMHAFLDGKRRDDDVSHQPLADRNPDLQMLVLPPTQPSASDQQMDPYAPSGSAYDR